MSDIKIQIQEAQKIYSKINFPFLKISKITENQREKTLKSEVKEITSSLKEINNYM